MRTYIYIDGFNLYYGCLRGKPQYKWLDLQAMCQSVLGDEYDIATIKYYTANIKARGRDKGAQERQRAYLSAIKKHIPNLEICFGKFQATTPFAKPVKPLPDGVVIPEEIKELKIHKSEEKGSDVNLAADMLNDAWLNAFDCAVMISNDSDLEAPLRLIRTHHPRKKLGLIPPVAMEEESETASPIPSKDLSQHSHFIRNIRTSHLVQMPDKISGTNYHRPAAWK